MENNKLIAEFMGRPYKQEFLEKRIGGVFEEVVLTEELQYNTSWDWLMPVVSKCREESNPEDSHWEKVYYSLEECDMNTTYKAVVEFIKQTKIK